jgi:hypothetical protein
MQDIDNRVDKLLEGIQDCLTEMRLAVIIDDFWDTDDLKKLELAQDYSSSLLVTSRERIPDWPSYQTFWITDNCNQAQKQAILASYVARDPEANALPSPPHVLPELQVQL